MTTSLVGSTTALDVFADLASIGAAAWTLDKAASDKGLKVGAAVWIGFGALALIGLAFLETNQQTKAKIAVIAKASTVVPAPGIAL